MMDLSPLAQAILVYTALAVGVLATLLTSFAQFVELPAAFRGKPSAALVRRGFLAASVGMGSVGGSVLALELGGPGAIGWMWIASLLGMGAIYAEVRLSVKLRREGRADSAQALVAGLPAGLGKPLALLFTLALLVFALSAGSVLQTQQSGELLATVGGDRWMVAVFLVGATAVGMAVPKLRAFVAALGPVAVLLYVIAVVLIIIRAPGAVGPAFSAILSGIGGSGDAVAGGAAGGGLLMAMQAGVLRATLATEAGLGSAGFTPEADTIKDPQAAARSAMLAPLVSGILVPTITALAVMTATPLVGQRIDEAGERRPDAANSEAGEDELAQIAEALSAGNVDALREEDKLRTMAAWLPLEVPQSRGMVGSLQAGQTILLPMDAVAEPGAADAADKLEGDMVYPMVMRASPRGAKLDVKEGQKAIAMRAAEETEVVRELVFRDRDPARNPFPAYDLRYELESELIGPEGRQLVRLTPKDDIDLYQLSKVYDGPYLVYGDYYFEGRVVRMFHREWGAHYAMVSAKDEPGRHLNLRSVVSSGAFRGPYFDAGEPRPPTAMIARAGLEQDLPVGSRLQLEYQSPGRGMEFGRLLLTGELVTPPWRFLAETKVAVLRHKEDPSKDLRIPVNHAFVNGTLRFTSARPDIADFAKADRFRDYTGPYLAPPAYRFEVEVHSGARAPASSDYLERLGIERSSWTSPFAARRTLVAVSPYAEAQGSRRELYDPHPSEVAPFMDGPVVSGAGLERLGWAAKFGRRHGDDVLLAISVLILALTTMIAWSNYGARAADFALGRGAGMGFRVVFLLVGLAGAVLGVLPILRLADHAMLALLVLHGLGMLWATARLRQS